MKVRSINARLIWALMGIAVGACLPLGGLIVSHLRTAQAEMIATDGAYMTATTERMLSAEATRLDTLVRGIVSFPALLDAVAAGDRAKVGDRLGPMHQSLLASGVTALAVTTQPATVFYRSNKPEFFGDNVTARRPDLVATEQTGTPTRSFTRVSGGIGLAYSTPMVRAGQRIAVLSAQMDLGLAFYKRVAEAVDADVVAHSIESTGTAIIGGTIPTGVLGDDGSLRASFDGKVAPRAAFRGDTPVLVALLPIRTFDGKPTIVLELVRDRSAAAAGERNLQIALFVATGTILFAAIVAALSCWRAGSADRFARWWGRPERSPGGRRRSPCRERTGATRSAPWRARWRCCATRPCAPARWRRRQRRRAARQRRSVRIPRPARPRPRRISAWLSTRSRRA